MASLWRWLLDWRSHLQTLAWVLLIFFGVHLWQSRDVPEGPAPTLDAPMLAAYTDASRLQQWLARHRGQVVAVHFWASGCPVCKASADNITRLQADWPIVSVALQSGDAPSVQRHLQQAALPWPTALDPDGSLARAWGVQAVPATVFLDREGRVASASMGYTSTLGLWVRLWWVRLLQR